MRRIIREATGVFADGFELSKEMESLFQRKCFYLATTRSLTTNGLNKSYKSNRTYSFSFLFVGRLEKVKGIDILLQSLVLLNEAKRDVHLTLVGTGSMERWAREFVYKRGLRGGSKFKKNSSIKGLQPFISHPIALLFPPDPSPSRWCFQRP